MLKTRSDGVRLADVAYHLGEGRMLKTFVLFYSLNALAYHLGEGRMLKTLLLSINIAD